MTALNGCSASVPVGPPRPAVAASRSGSPARAPRERRPTSGKAGTYGIVALFAIVTILAGVALLDRPAPAPAPATAAAPPVASSTVPVAPPAPKPVATATLHVESDPPGAKVKEEGDTMCAATPCDIVYSGQAADPSVEHMLAFHLPGYKLERKVTSATASAVTVKLTKAR